MTPSSNSDSKGVFYLEDLHVGQRFISGTHQLDEKQVIAFAREFDPQSFHTDPIAAKDSFFGGLVASGWHTGAISMRLLAECGLNISGGLIGASIEMNWPRPTQPDALLRLEVEILELRPSKSKPERGLVTIRGITRNQLDEVALVFTATLIAPRRGTT